MPTQNAPTTNMNPGDLRYAGQSGATPTPANFAKFSSPQQGYGALLNDITAKMTAHPAYTLADFANQYAPPTDGNNSAQYAANLANQLGVAPNATLGSLQGRIGDLANAVAKNEGYQGTTGAAVTPSSSGTTLPTGQPAASAPPEASSTDPQGFSGIGQQLANRINQVSGALTNASTGQINWGSGILQSAGAIAGGIGDVTNDALELIPGVSKLESGLGNVVGDLAGTAVGQSVVNAGMQFAQAHPEITGDLGAAANIASVFPIFKGIGIAKDALSGAVTSAFEDQLSGVATKELTEAATKTITGREVLSSAEARGLNPIQTIIKGKYLPDVGTTADGKYVYQTAPAYQALKESLATDEAHLQGVLESAGARQPADLKLASQGIRSTTGKISLSSLKNQTLASARSELAGNPDYSKILDKIGTDFDGLKASIGGRDDVSLQELNGMKRTVRDSVNFKSDNLDTNSRYIIGQSMMKKVEDTASSRGISEVTDLNKQMGSKIEALKVLKNLNGKAVKLGKYGRLLKEGGADVAGALGEGAGNIAGVPFAGTLAGRGLYSLIPGKTPGTALRLLSSASSPTEGLLSGARGLAKIGRGVAQQKATKGLTSQ